MALFGRLVTLAKSPQGRKLLGQAQRAARDPQNRERLEKVRTRIQHRGNQTAKTPASETHEGGAGGSDRKPQS